MGEIMNYISTMKIAFFFVSFASIAFPMEEKASLSLSDFSGVKDSQQLCDMYHKNPTGHISEILEKIKIIDRKYGDRSEKILALKSIIYDYNLNPNFWIKKRYDYVIRKKSLIYYAIKMRNDELVSYLLKKGASPLRLSRLYDANVIEKMYGEGIDHRKIRTSQDTEFLEYLARVGVDLTRIGRDKDAFSFALRYCPQLALTLLKNNESITFNCSESGYYNKQGFAKYRIPDNNMSFNSGSVDKELYEQLFSLMLERGFDPNAFLGEMCRKENYNSLFILLFYLVQHSENMNLIELLFQKGVNPNLPLFYHYHEGKKEPSCSIRDAIGHDVNLFKSNAGSINPYDKEAGPRGVDRKLLAFYESVYALICSYDRKKLIEN